MWNQITPVPTFGTMTAVAFTTLEAQLTDKRNQRGALYASLWDKVKRVRNAVKGTYGDDSSQSTREMVGGTRMSERKFGTRITATPE